MQHQRYKTIIENCGTPTFVYSEDTLLKNIERLKTAISKAGLNDRIRINVSYFTNSHPHLIRLIADKNLGLTLQAIEEWHQLEKFGLDGMNCNISPTALSDEEIEFFLSKGTDLNVSLPEELEFAFTMTDKIGVRIDLSPEQNQRTGLKIAEFGEITRISNKMGKKIHAIHTYPGTGSDFDKLIEHAEDVFRIFKKHFPQANEINLGGGFAFEYDEKNVEDKHFPWEKYFREIRELVQKYDIPDDVILTIEPGRDIFADVGEFIVKVHRVHNRPHERTKRISTNGSFVYMPSAMQRKRQHQLTFLDSQCNEKIDRFGYGSLSGCTTISSDYLFPGIVKIPQDTIKGDHIVVHDIGAYGASQHMSFLNKRPATEVLVRKDGTVEVISERGEFTDKVRNVPLQSRRIGGENES